MKRVILFLATLTAACELQEVELAPADDVIVAEITLRAGDPVQTALLHRSLQNGRSAPVPNARIEVTDEQGRAVRFQPGPAANCFMRDSAAFGTCYFTDARFDILPGSTYRLRIEVEDRVLHAVTRVPDAFEMRRPAAAVCNIEPNTTLEIEWTQSPSSWVYVSEAIIHGLEPFLAEKDIQLEESPMRIFGLSLSNQDTTVVFPPELGLFQRFDPDLTEALVAIQTGLPLNSSAELVVAATDRNYVNWERGGNFNPSGLVRVPSIRGDGTGVFGSMVLQKFIITVGRTGVPAC